MAGGDAVGLLNYMRGYILLDFAGRGLPEDHSSASAHFALTRSKISFDPTITGAYDMALAESDPRASPAQVLRAVGTGGAAALQVMQSSFSTFGPMSNACGSSSESGSELGRSASQVGSSLSGASTADADLRRRLAEAEAERDEAKARALDMSCNGKFCGRPGCEGDCKARRKGIDFARAEGARVKKAELDKQVEAELKRRGVGGAQE